MRHDLPTPPRIAKIVSCETRPRPPERGQRRTGAQNNDVVVSPVRSLSVSFGFNSLLLSLDSGSDLPLRRPGHSCAGRTLPVVAANSLSLARARPQPSSACLDANSLQRLGAPSQLLQSTRRSQHPSGPGSFVFAAQGHVGV